MGKEKHFIDQSARVYCGIRGRDVDIETCLACGRLAKHDLDSRQPYLICEGPDEPVSPASSLRPRTAT